MKLYVAGPMTGLPRWGFDAFDAATAQLRDFGYSVYSPAEIERESGFDPDAPVADFTRERREEAMRRDLDLVLFVDAVVVLPGWGGSTGARLEVDVANAVGTPVYDLDQLTNRKAL